MLQKRIFILMLILGFICNYHEARAQQVAAKPGPNGIFVLFGNQLPVGFQYKLERKTTEEQRWQEIVRTSFPDLTEPVVLGNLLTAGAKNANFIMPDSSTLQRFISLLKHKLNTDSVYVFNSQPAYLEAMGVGFFDDACKPGVSYQFRVSQVNRIGKVLKSEIVTSSPFPGKTKLSKPVFTGDSNNENRVMLHFQLLGETLPANVRVFKQVKLQNAFQECFAQKMFSRGVNGVEFLLIDSMVTKGMVYRYYLAPVDILGNAGEISDTILIEFGKGIIPPLTYLNTTAGERSIILNWRIPNTEKLRGIEIYRAKGFDTEFSLVSRVSATDTIYIDRQIDAGTSYNYYLVLQGLFENSAPSATIAGRVEEKRKPLLTPDDVKVVSSEYGNLISWKRMEQGTRGYYVYRGEGYTNADHLLSNLIVSDSLQNSYVDSTSNLVPGQVYCYAVSSVNKGNIEGAKAIAVVAQALKPELPTPLNVQVKNCNQSALLIWDDIFSMSGNITGYTVYRALAEKAQDWAAISSKEFPYRGNSYLDTTVLRGVSYVYAITTTGVQQSESARSSSVEFLVPEILPVPPSGLRATRTDDGIVLSWDAPAIDNLEGYRIYREKLDGEKEVLITIDPYTTVHTDTQLLPGTWYYTVSTITADGRESEQCDEVGVLIE